MEAARQLPQDKQPQARGPSGAAGLLNRTGDGSRYQPLVILLLAIVAGIVLDRFCRHALPSTSAWLPVWWSVSAGCLFAWRRLRVCHGVAAGRILLVAVALSAAAWHDLRWQLFSRDEIRGLRTTTRRRQRST